MLYFLCASAGACLGFILAAFLTAGNRADVVTTASAANLRATSLERANSVLRRELAELRTNEVPRDHGYGAPRG